MALLRPLMAKAEARFSNQTFFFPCRKSRTYTLALTSLLALSVVILVLLALYALSLPIGPLFAPSRAHDRSHGEKTEGFGQRGRQWTEVISWEPRAFVYHNFLVRIDAGAVLYSCILFNSKHAYLILGEDAEYFMESILVAVACITTPYFRLHFKVVSNRYSSSIAFFYAILFNSVLAAKVIIKCFLLDNTTASKEECEYIIQLAKPHMKKSTVVNSTTGGSEDSSVRTSSGMFLQRGRDKIIRSIEKRIADYTFIPVEHGEGLQVLHYEVGQKYEPHLDYFADEFNTKNGGQRIATFLMYLSDVEEGGETVFPNAKVNSSSLPGYNELSDCGKAGLALKPKMGDALLFWSMKPDATMDPLSLHGACPVIKGNKWSAPKWMRLHEYKA
ncbi:P4Hc [Musa troglodytarum]|uniref:procollagen-proline 4-dioxygenase n=1 Tax=Musa troglodytarum TaxID=320322 RepID=A0A9E7E7P9_9LILI|nr:P4Hc [Musa troglodytarum]